MPAEIIELEEVKTYAERSGVVNLSDAEWQEAIDRATDKVRQSALNVYTSASFELLTALTAPDEMREHTLALALGVATKADAGRPEAIDKAYDEASRWLGFLAGGKTHYDQLGGAVLVAASGSVGSVTYKRRNARVFDDDNCAWSRRNSEI